MCESGLNFMWMYQIYKRTVKPTENMYKICMYQLHVDAFRAVQNL